VAWPDTQAAAWGLHVHQFQVGIHPRTPGATIAAINTPLAHDARFPPIARTRRWVVGSSCA
jgi:hypothetical protein